MSERNLSRRLLTLLTFAILFLCIPIPHIRDCPLERRVRPGD
jgi:hypothetical protein